MRIAALLALPALLLAESEAPNPPTQFEQARNLYYKAIEGDKKAYRSAQTLFSQMYCEEPMTPIVQVYYGSLRLLEASNTWALWNKNRLSREGIVLMDRAVAAQPASLEIRFVRAVTTYHLPGFFHRKQQSKQDFAYLARAAAQAARTGALEPRLAAASLYFHGELLHDAGQDELARASWRNAIAAAPSSPAAQGAREALEKLQR